MFNKKDFLRCFLAFCLGFALIGLQLLFFIDQIILNPRTYYEYLNQPTYFDLLRTQIDDGLTQIATLTNIPAERLTTVVSDEEIKTFGQQAIKDYIAYFRGDVAEYTEAYDTTSLKNSVEEYVKEYVGQNSSTYDAMYQDQVNEIVEKAQTSIEGYVLVLDPQLVIKTGIGGKISVIAQKIPMIEMGCLVISVLLTFCLWLSNKRHRMRTLWWFGSSLFVSSVVLLIPGLYLHFTNVAGKIGLEDSSIKWITENCIGSLITRWNVMQGLCLFLSIAMMVSYVFIRKRKINQSKS